MDHVRRYCFLKLYSGMMHIETILYCQEDSNTRQSERKTKETDGNMSVLTTSKETIELVITKIRKSSFEARDYLTMTDAEDMWWISVW